jgi:AraC-like DNA-binding protein
MLYEKPYLNPILSLGDLAEFLSITDKKLSFVLNQNLNTNFYDFINQYRIDDFLEKAKLEAYANYTLFGIAQDCGFNSKSSFNRIFKNKMNMLPSEYKRSLSATKTD